MMRVTQAGLWDLVRSNLASNAARTRALEEQATTGLSVNRASDAPELTGQIDRLNAASADQAVYSTNAGTSTSVLSQMDSVLGSVHDALTRARELAVQMSGDTMSAEDRSYAAEEINAIRDTVLSLANSDFAGKYLFSGTATDTEPFDSTGTYAGTTDEPQTRVGENTWVTTSRDGSSVFQGDIDIFGALSDFATALSADDTAGIEGALDTLDSSLDQVMQARATVGADTNIADDALSLAESLKGQLATSLGDLVSVDPAETYMQLSEMRASYQTALQVASSARSQNLFDLI